jgi:hypothetical protein
MSVLFVEGFETSADQSDLAKRGLLTATSPVSVAGIGVLPIPSRTGVAGTGLALRGAYGTATTLPCSAAGTSDFGLLPLGQSVYSLWQAGGFALGVNASFNSQNTLQIGVGDTMQIAYDGSTYYWAIVYTGAAYQVAYSSDLKSWTVTATQPTGMLVNCTIMVASGSGASATILVGSKSGSTAFTPQYTTNLGATWTSQSIGNASNIRNVVATGNSTTPYYGVGFVSGTGFRVYTYTSLGATPTSLATPALTGNITYGVGWSKKLSGYCIACGIGMGASSNAPISGATSAFAYCPVGSDPGVAGNWVMPASQSTYFNDVTYLSGNFYAAGYGGIWKYNVSGSTWTQVVNIGTAIVWSITTNGTILVAVGQDPTNTYQCAIWTSTDGVTWTKQNRFVVTASGVNYFATVYWDGARFVMTSTSGNNVLAVSTDGVAWNALYVPDYGEQTGTGSMSFLGVFSGTQNPGTGIFTPWGTAAGNVSGVGVTAAAVASNARTVTATTVTAGALSNTAQTASVGAIGAALGQQPPSTLSHYYEFIFVTVPGTVNLFNVYWAIDNGQFPTALGQYQFASSTDTTGAAQLFLNLPRNGQFTVIDDVYLTNFTGPYHVGRLGVQRIYPLTTASDVGTDQFTNTLAGSNAATVNSALSNSEGYVYSTATTAQDVYATTNAVPGGNAINAVQVEGFLTAYNSSAGAGTVGVQSNGVQKFGSQISTNTNPTRAQVIAETDPNTNVPWTTSGLNAVDIVVAKTS